MKAYHIAQARNPADLPEWLFDEKERGLTSRLSVEERYEEPALRSAPLPEPPRSQSTSTPFPTRYNTRNYDVDAEKATMSRAALRLKELRDAKANTNTRIKFSETPHPRRAAATIDMNEGTRGEMTRQLSVPAQPASIPRRLTANMDDNGKRPLVQGLPGGVRPRRV